MTNLNIHEINICLFSNKDELYFETDLPYQYPQLQRDNGNMALRLTCPPGTGILYCKTHFPDIPLNVKDCRYS